MFILHSSNRTENLVAHLTAVISNAPLSSPFKKELFLIQSQGMERWLSQQLANEFKVWGNYEFLFPGKFFSSLAEKIDSHLNDAAFDRHLMLWRLEALLRQLDSEDLLPLKQYLSGDSIALKRYQLALQVAKVFDQYQIMRPDMIAAWQANKTLYHTATERWQKALWRQVTQQTGVKHRGSLWLQVIDKLNKAEEGTFSTQLPERICIFGVNTMPPLFLKYLEGLSKHCQLHLFLLNPSNDFWADIETKHQRIANEESFVGHPLLSTLGQQGREFQAILLEDEITFTVELESFEENEAPLNNLQRLQNDILNNAVETRLTRQADDSISIHSCHSRMREVEVLKNQLLHALEQDSSLQLRDIVVIAPDIQDYESFISAVFSDIQHAIADRSLRLSNHALDAFIRFLSVSQSRFGWQTVLDLLEQAVVYPSFGLSEADVELIKHWIMVTQVRWGKSAQHKKALGLPELTENTWQAMLDRLLMGYAVGSDAQFVEGVLPYKDIEGVSASALGGLCDFMNLLFKASAELKQAKTLKNWHNQLSYYADQLLVNVDPIELQQLKELLAELSADVASVHHDTVELQVIVSWMEGTVSERKSSNGFLRGQLTFCSMLPMRSIPFKVIALLGMNDGEFPKIDRNPTFDLLSQHFRKGDRSHRADDRYQFLEILLSARQRLIMTYIGQSISQNNTIPPSVIISELLEVLQDSYTLPNPTIKEPLQAFSTRYFDGSSDKLINYSPSDLATAVAITGTKSIITFSPCTLETETEQVIDLNDLFNFFRHPQKYFINRQVGVRFNSLEAKAEEREPFVIDKLAGYSIYQDWIETELSGGKVSVQKMQAQGRWLSGVAGELAFNRQQQVINEFVDQIRLKNLGERLDDLPIDIKIESYRLVGKLSHRYENGRLLYRYADLKGKDFVAALLHHLISHHVEPQTTHLLSADKDLILPTEVVNKKHLLTWLSIYQKGLQQHNAFFVEAAFAYIQQTHILERSSRASKSPLDAAKDRLIHAITQDYEPELKLLYGKVADVGLILNEDFEQQCQDLLQTAWNAAQAE
ncbi:MAG: exodeoxyribonuclease V subunit gamma [Methylococcales bacterium]|nr:exodeoxyribonuclease V subunit gamma [Methylococcales bacterium]